MRSRRVNSQHFKTDFYEVLIATSTIRRGMLVAFDVLESEMTTRGQRHFELDETFAALTTARPGGLGDEETKDAMNPVRIYPNLTSAELIQI